jgi:hypothetical protein
MGIILSAAMISMIAACGGGFVGGAVTQSDLSGSSEDVLEQILSGIEETDVRTPMPLPPTALDGDMSQSQLGLSAADFNNLVESASFSMAAIATFAHQIFVIEAVDAVAALEIKNLISSDSGFDPHKWICVFPEKAIVVESGNYVLLVASTSDVVDAALSVFEAAAGNIGNVNTFWEFADDGTGDLGGGELITLG